MIENFDNNVALIHCHKNFSTWPNPEYVMFLRLQMHICENEDYFGMADGGSPGGEWFWTQGKFPLYFNGLTLH